MPRAPLRSQDLRARPRTSTGRKLGAMVQLGTRGLASFAAWPQNLLRTIRARQGRGLPDAACRGASRDPLALRPHRPQDRFPGRLLGLPGAGGPQRGRRLRRRPRQRPRHRRRQPGQRRRLAQGDRSADRLRLVPDHPLGPRLSLPGGSALFTPPELQGRRLDDVVRTARSRPLRPRRAGLPPSLHGPAPVRGPAPRARRSVEAAMREGLFAFGREAARQGWSRLPSPRLRDVSTPPRRSLRARLRARARRRRPAAAASG